MHTEEQVNEIYHHGVKGMKWGVRRYQNKDGTLTSAGKKRYRAQKQVQKYDATEPKKNGYYSDEFNHDRTLKKGSLVYRYSSKDNEQNEGGTFVYFTKNDDYEYGSHTMDGLVTGDKSADYKYMLQAKKDIRIPSIQNMMKTYIGMIYLDELKGKAITGETALRLGKNKLTSFLDENGKLTLEQAQSKLYDEVSNNTYSSFRRFMNSTLKGSSRDLGTSGEEYVKRLQEKGYDAMPDLFDNTGFNKDGYTNIDNPIFIFDRASSLAVKGVNNALSKNSFTEKYEMVVDNKSGQVASPIGPRLEVVMETKEMLASKPRPKEEKKVIK